jgi:hypothetical protein
MAIGACVLWGFLSLSGLSYLLVRRKARDRFLGIPFRSFRAFAEQLHRCAVCGGQGRYSRPLTRMSDFLP